MSNYILLIPQYLTEIVVQLSLQWILLLELLSTHLDAQLERKLRQEIVDARSRYGDLEYDELVALPCLDAVCRETLRL